MPLLSIITINYNNLTGLQKTLTSVLSQSWKAFEYIVIDGGSTDGSKELIETKANSFAYWVSEKDKGIYNAMNKGIAKATGEYLLFLNSGDFLYYDRVLENIQSHLKDSDMLYGNVIFSKSEYENIAIEYDEPIDFGFFAMNNLPHQATFIKKELFHKLGMYDETIYVCADWKFAMDAVLKHKVTTQHIDAIIAVYDLNGISSDANNATKLKAVQRAILEKEYGLYIKVFDDLKALEKRHADLEQAFRDVNQKYLNLSNSRAVKTYFRIKNMISKE